jgi:hypothetical protein
MMKVALASQKRRKSAKQEWHKRETRGKKKHRSRPALTQRVTVNVQRRRVCALYTPVIAEFGTPYTVVLYLPTTFTNERSILSLSLSCLPWHILGSPSYSFFLFCHSLSPLRVCVQSPPPHFLLAQQPCLRSSSCSWNVLVRQTQRTTTARKEKKRDRATTSNHDPLFYLHPNNLYSYIRDLDITRVYIAKPIAVQVLRTHNP